MISVVHLIQFFMKSIKWHQNITWNNVDKRAEHNSEPSTNCLFICFSLYLNCIEYKIVMLSVYFPSRSQTSGSKRPVRVPARTCWGFLWGLTAMCNLLCWQRERSASVSGKLCTHATTLTGMCLQTWSKLELRQRWSLTPWLCESSACRRSRSYFSRQEVLLINIIRLHPAIVVLKL